LSPTKVDIGKNDPQAERLSALPGLYDGYRISLLNVKYYGYKLKRATRITLFAEIVVAIATGGVAGWAIRGTDGGKIIWSLIGGTATVLAAVKPVLPLSRNISNYSRLHAGHNSNFLSFKDLVERVRSTKRFTTEMEREYQHLTKRHRELAAFDEPYPSKKLIVRFQDEVKLRFH
jgi:hypothetical protein